ncbi:leucine-rich repeat receptor-like protein kinase family protein [Artemisia annua]|uniref:Leucine-rich repeat receptor-like protein kinase family protein n=1 Tax=Artemisia annua TaxID=35608 RepID=A0A2U1QPE8_ARTAN|nr:leucine-rich repeat receptor-like protein kinase family protein [Artemisia annua]
MQKQVMASSKFLLLSLALLLIALSFVPNFTSASLEEANALQKWKESLKVPNNSQILSSWTPLPTNTSAPTSCPSWFGIACNTDGNINRLNLSSSELKGTLHQFPFSILGNLTHFELSVNSFFGPIPPEIGLLSKLVYLDLSTNQFSGVIPPTVGKLNREKVNKGSKKACTNIDSRREMAGMMTITSRFEICNWMI